MVKRTAFCENIYFCNFLARKTTADCTTELRSQPCGLSDKNFLCLLPIYSSIFPFYNPMMIFQIIPGCLSPISIYFKTKPKTPAWIRPNSKWISQLCCLQYKVKTVSQPDSCDGSCFPAQHTKLLLLLGGGQKADTMTTFPRCSQQSSPCAFQSKQKPEQATLSGLHFGVKAPVALRRPSSLLEQFSTVAWGLQRSSGVKSIMLHAALYQVGLRERVKWSAAMLFELIRDIFNLIKVVSTIDFGSFNYHAVMASGSTDLWWALSALAHIEEKALCLL